MKTFKKVCMILISVTAVAGIGCIIAAFVMGADPRQIRNYAEGKTSGKLQTEERNIRADQIRKLNIDIGSGNVKLQNGNQDHLIIKKKGSWEPVILKSDGEIEIKQKTAYEIKFGDWSSTCALPISYAPVFYVFLTLSDVRLNSLICL